MKDDLKRNIAFMIRSDGELRASGELVSAEGLATPHEAKLVRGGREGPPTDGIFPEAKEYLAGYWIVDVASPERARGGRSGDEHADRSAPGDERAAGNLRLNRRLSVNLDVVRIDARLRRLRQPAGEIGPSPVDGRQ
jgi:hypothetical protein